MIDFATSNFLSLVIGHFTMNIFEESLSVLKSKVQLRKLFQDMHVEDIQRVISRIESIYEEKLDAQKEVEQEQQRKREAIEAVLKEMQDKGLDIGDLAVVGKGTESNRKGKTRQRYQFEYQTEDGTTVTWEGATTGRIPAEFTAYLKRTGKERKDCIVTEL